ncbi:formate dehydrogenase accessory sulfurtransferase FdhD [Raoultibacter phocaeensis]|uniref:formate dehydrogenase accessory sulfurtransferase FdhD n=1 Tax=Raoultibacter phocaeensis TaxID=2479841 RepID=UPI00111A916F|nr:formate dehydrogenase accessory sulfurtransferase FdhD [Raoultibacter phocaeensis]
MKTVDLSVHGNHASRAGYPMLHLGADGGGEEAFDEVQTESALDILLDGKPVMRLVCDLSDIAALVVGRLFTEGFIGGVCDVECVYVNRHATEAHVTLTSAASRKLWGKAKGTGHVSIATHGAPQREFGSRLHPVSPIPWSVDDVFALARVFSSDSPMHRRTFGAHSCYVALGDRVLFCCEDLGRHNAFDKAIGRALIEGVDLKRATVFTSGRTPVDMTAKAIRAGIPLLVSKAVPTNLAIELARNNRLALICSAHPDSMRVFNDPLGCAGARRCGDGRREAQGSISWKGAPVAGSRGERVGLKTS